MFRSTQLTWVRPAWLRCVLGAAALAVSGCGGVADEVVVSTTANTPLVIAGASSIPSLTVGMERMFSVTVTDIDGIDSVTVTLDGAPIPVTINGNTYSITLPGTLAVGPHTLVVTGRGLAPDGTREVPRSVSVTFTVFPRNTPATVTAVTGQNHYTVGATPTLSTSVVDPDGIASVTAALDGTALAVTAAGGVYSVTLPGSVAAGVHALVFTVTGLHPDGSLEAAQTVTQAITVYPPNTPLTISSISGPASYTVGTAHAYTTQVMDPDAIASVTATLDGVDIPVVSGAGGYTVDIPASTKTGTHTLVVTATGRLPDGSLEAPHSVTQTFIIYPPNTPLTISAISTISPPPSAGPPGPTLYRVTVQEPDGVPSVVAYLDGVPTPVTQSGSDYQISVPASYGCARIIDFTATGKNPDGSFEASQTQTLDTSSTC